MDFKLDDFKLNGMELLSEQFYKNTDRLSELQEEDTRREITVEMGLDMAIGINKDDNKDIAYKTKFSLHQKLDNNEEVLSELHVEYLFSFYCEKLVLKNYSEINPEIYEELSSTLLNISYPYLREHVESVLKKGNLSIEMPLSV
ncbi:hypothetical protein [Clostridium algidicarnis]|uniref:hypothetical protein n=1 Tax=Clostridium algidicarnis TaxID=37659 RepID=UPI003FD7D526